MTIHPKSAAGLDGVAEVDGFSRRDGAIVQVLAGAKAAAGACKNDDPRAFRFVERRLQLGMHGAGEAVQPVGPVERDAGDAVRLIEHDGFVAGHARVGARTFTQTQSIAD